MDLNQIDEAVLSSIRDVLGLEPDDFTLDCKIAKDLEADSLDVLEIVLGVEEKLEIEIPDEDVEKFVIVRDLVDYARGRLNG